MKRLVVRVTMAAGTLVLFVVQLFGAILIDSALRSQSLREENLDFTVEESRTSSTERVILSLQGTQVSAETQTRNHRRDWAQWGKVVVPEFPREVFNREKIVKEAYDWLVQHNVREVVLTGSSGGGQMELELIRYMRSKNSQIKIVGVILNDTPNVPSDLVDERAGSVKHWFPGVGQNLLSPLFWGASWDPPTPALSTDMELLAEHHARSKSYPLSGWTDQVRGILNFKPAQPGEFAGIPFAYLESNLGDGKGHDGVVKHTATTAMLRAFGVGEEALTRVPSPHAEYVAFESAWRTAFQRAFERLFSVVQ